MIFLRHRLRNEFDVDTAYRAHDAPDTSGSPINGKTDIIFLFNLQRFNNKHPINRDPSHAHGKNGMRSLRTASGESANLTPPALPRPPESTCALTTTVPPKTSAAATASFSDDTTTPPGMAQPYRQADLVPEIHTA